MTGSLASSAQRRPAGFDALAARLATLDPEPMDYALSAEEAEAEARDLIASADRGEHHPWLRARAADLAAAYPRRESLQRAVARLTDLYDEPATAKSCWRGVVERFPGSAEALSGYLAAIAHADGPQAAERIAAAYQAKDNASDSEETDAALDAMARLLDIALAWRAAHPPIRIPGVIGPIAMIGGTLGGGGAERQLANTALALQARIAARDGRLLGPITILCRKLDRRRANDFHLPRLEAAGIRVIDYLRLEPWGGDRATSRLAPHAALVDRLPDRMREGVVQLVEHFRHAAPDVVQIWQDGMIHAAGLAALLAGVPRIILNVRTMPPTERADRRRPGQQRLYRRLLHAPGVTLTTNSAAAARAYQAWLDLPGRAVRVIPNGVEPPGIEGDAAAQALWEKFDAATGGGFTLAGAMRLDDNKRPLAWLAIAEALARRLPHARFILLGSGPLRAACEDFAARRGLAARTLFAGRSREVGFWLSRADALALTSRHEGLPNALIEAQMLGLPVVGTPAGGAPDAVAPLDCNLILPEAERVDAEAAADHLAALAARDRASAAADADRLRAWAAARFTVDAMAERTLDLFG